MSIIISEYNKQRLASLFIGLVLGLVLWLFSPVITGASEPWDAEKNAIYYPVALFLFGFIACIPYPNQYLAATLGIFIGQICYLFFFRLGPLFLIGAVLIALYIFAALFGAILGSRLLLKWGWPKIKL